MGGGKATLPTAARLALAAWITDALDGPVARRAGRSHTTWIGELDFPIDVFVVVALLLYLTAAGVVPGRGAMAYPVIAAAAVWQLQEQAVALAFRAPVDGLLLYTGWQRVPSEARLAVLYLAIALVPDGHRFCDVVGLYLVGMRRVLRV
jgi:hypothetical protein